MNASRVRQICWIAFILAGLFATDPSRLWASGRESSHKTKDLTLSVDSRWAGGRQGGYIPIRFRVRNTGKEAELEFRFSADPHINLPDVRKRITVGQNVTRQFTLSIPMITTPGQPAYGNLSVSQNGRPIEEFSQTISLPDNSNNEINCPSLLVVSSKKVDCEQFSIAANSLSTPAGSLWSSGFSGSFAEDYEVIEPLMLPDSAIDYSALDVLAVSLETFGKFPEGTRSAILNWVQTGGKLILYETGAPAAEVKELQSVLPFPSTGDWKTSDLVHRRSVNIFSDEDLSSGMEFVISGSGTVTEYPQDDNSRPKYLWDADAEAFAVHPLMLGHVIAFPENPFPGSPYDWAWLLGSIEPEAWRWTVRHGISTRQTDESFNLFTIPGVGGIPKVAFIVLISGFAIFIGPLNYFLLRRRRQLFLLVVTIPGIAFLTSCSLFAYAAFADGFGVTSRARSFTLLDQRNKTAVTLGRFALYAGVAPSTGLQFSNETAVYPLQPLGGNARQGVWDWTSGQHLTSGWIRSRTPAQFVTVSQQTQRGRVEVSPAAAGTIQVANGLEWAIDTLFVIDEQGDLYQGTDLSAGQSAELLKVKPLDAMQTLSDIYNEHPLRLSGATTPNSSPSPTTTTMTGSFVMVEQTRTEVNYANGLLESRLRELLKPRKTQDITSHRRTYLAILKQNPGLELGVEQTDAQGDFHVLQGLY